MEYYSENKNKATAVAERNGGISMGLFILA